MLPDIGASEIMLIAIVALIVVGPKDLPVLLRRLGQFMAKLRGMAAEFRASFDEMARQSELDELRKEVDAMRQGQIAQLSEVSADANRTVAEIDQTFADVGVDIAPPLYDYTPLADAAHEPSPPAPPKPKAKSKSGKAAPAGAAPRKPRAKKIVE